IGVFAIMVAIQMGFELQPKASGEVPGKPALSIAGVVIGWASSIFGIGGGSLTVPFLTWRSVPMQQAVATSSACGLPIAIAGALSFMAVGWHNAQRPPWSLGFVYLPALVGIAVTSLFFARQGARLAHRLSPKLLKRLFALLLLSVGINFLIEGVPEARLSADRPRRRFPRATADPLVRPDVPDRYRRRLVAGIAAGTALRPGMEQGQALRPGVLGRHGGDRRWAPGLRPVLRPGVLPQ